MPVLQGPSEVFRIVKVIRISRPHDSLPGIDSCCTVTPFPGLPVGSNTETYDDCRRRQFSIGKLSVRKLPFQSNNSRRIPGCKRVLTYLIEKKAKKLLI